MEDADYRVRGFRSWAVEAGLKKHGGLDLGLIHSEVPAAAAGVFTTNKVKAAPILVSQEHITSGRARAILANAGNANACTGPRGLADARRSAAAIAGALGAAPEEVLVASTGVIGLPLDVGRIETAVPELVRGLSDRGLPCFAEAVMTTDRFAKLSRFEANGGGADYRIAGTAKGAGMIMPDMATMLCFVLTDIALPRVELEKALYRAADLTFNRITVDGDTSTNDTVMVLANGLAGNRPLSPPELEEFREGLRSVMESLALMMVRDGEGATKVVCVRVRGALGREDALKAARAVANSALVKTACYGQDPNWGRIMAAVGRSGADMAEDLVSISVDDVMIVEAGTGKGEEAERRAASRMRNDRFTLTVDLHLGEAEEEVFTCDLTEDYVRINAGYRT